MSWFERGLLIWLLLLCLPAQAELRLVLQPAGLSELQRSASQALLVEARRSLPPVLVSRLDSAVPVRWSTALDAEVVGRASATGAVLLNYDRLAALTAVDSEGAQKASRKLLLATLVHELAHLYDRGRYVSREQHPLLQDCQSQQQSLGLIGLPARCRGQAERQFTLSDDPRLLDLAGWPEQMGERGAREVTNHQRDRSPDSYELASPAEFVAVNLEYFLLDPQYACRRPALFAYFRQHFSWAPADVQACSGSYPYLNASLDPSQQALGRIDPERVYAVHYLLAEPNEAWASRWGHSMLRLVVCAPGRPRGPDCMLDVDQHLVLSFRAFVEDVQLSSWDGLTGNYPSRLFILPLTQVVDEYTKLELRSLSSIPLQLNAQEREGLLQQAAQLHWSYDGTYYFINNNCAVETLKLLRSGTANTTLRNLESITPTGLLALLEGRGLADDSVLADRDWAMRRGYFFDSFRERYQVMFDVVRAHLKVPSERVEDWLALGAQQRANWLNMGDQRTTAALLLLEQAAQRRQLLLVRQELKERYLALRDTGHAELNQTEQLMRQLLAESGYLSRPAELLTVGYGLPQADEWQQLQQRSSERRQGLLDMAGSLDEQLLALLDAERRDEIEAGKHNISLLAERLRELHRAGGGLQLR